MKEKTSTTTLIRQALGVSISIMMLILMLLPARAAAQDSGIGWSLDANGLLYITMNNAASLQNNQAILSQVKTIDFEDGVIGIENNTFKGCVNLTGIQWNNIKEIGSNAFEGCVSLEQALLPTTLKKLRQYAFKGCSNLKTVQLQEGLESIETNAFDGCDKLESLHLPASVKSLKRDDVIAIQAFKGSSIKTLTVASGNLNFADVNNVLFNKEKTTLLYYPANVATDKGRYSVPQGVTAILDQAFFMNQTVEEVILPAHVTTLSSSTFSYAQKLKKATIQGDVSSMKAMFSDCPLLETVAIESKTPPADFDNGTFRNCPALTSIIVDGRSVEAYKSKLTDDALKALVKGSYNYSDLDLSTLPSGTPFLYFHYTEADGWMYATSNQSGTPTTPFTGTLTGVFNGTAIQIEKIPQSITPPVLTLRKATINAMFNAQHSESLILKVSGEGGSRIVTTDPDKGTAFSNNGTLTVRAERPLTIEGYNFGISNTGTLTLDGDITVKGGFWNLNGGTIAPGTTPNVRFMAGGTEKFKNEGTLPELLTLLFDVAPEAGKTVRVYEDVAPIVTRDFAADGTSQAYALFAPQGKHYLAWMGDTRLQNAATDRFEGGKTHDIYSFAINYWSSNTRHTDARPKVYSFKSTFPIDLPTDFPDDEGRKIIGWSLSKTDTDNYFTQLTRPAADADFKSLDLYSVPATTVTITTAGEEVTISKPNTMIKGQDIIAGNIILNTVEGVTFDRVATDVLTIGPSVNFTINRKAPQVSVVKHVVNNGGTFADQTGTVMKVLDAGGATLLAWEEIGNQFLALPGATSYAVPIKHTAAAVTLQQRATDNDNWVDVPPLEGTTAESIVVPVSTKDNRLVFRSGNTTLCTNDFGVVTTYRVTLPTVEGVTLKPHADAAAIYPEIAPGLYAVPFSNDFVFTLTLHEGYKQNSQPVVKVNGTVVPFNTTVKGYPFTVEGDVTVTVAGIVNDLAVTDPDPTPTPTPVYTVTLPATEGATISPAAGNHQVKEGDSFTFTLTLDAGYSESVPVVTADKATVMSLGQGQYKISHVYNNTVISISGIVKDVPTGIDHINSGTKVWCSDRTIHICASQPQSVQVITLSGSVVRRLDIPAGDTRLTGLAAGIYMIKVSDDTVRKVILQ